MVPGRGATTAVTRSPKRSSGMPTTTASNTSGWLLRAASTSSGKIFSPPELIDTDPRPNSVMVPFSSTVAQSPGRTQRTPWRSTLKVSAVLASAL